MLKKSSNWTSTPRLSQVSCTDARPADDSRPACNFYDWGEWGGDTVTLGGGLGGVSPTGGSPGTNDWFSKGAGKDTWQAGGGKDTSWGGGGKDSWGGGGGKDGWGWKDG